MPQKPYRIVDEEQDDKVLSEWDDLGDAEEALCDALNHGHDAYLECEPGS